MTWTAEARSNVTPKDLYDLSAAHKLMPNDMAAAIQAFRLLASEVEWWDISTEGKEKVADVLVFASNPGIASLVLVPVPEFFAPSVDFQADFSAAMHKILAWVFGSGSRKIESEVPVSRSRTKKALTSIGFQFEGKRKLGVHFHGREPEDTFLLGMLPGHLRRENDVVVQ